MQVRRISTEEKEDWGFKCSNCRKLADIELNFSSGKGVQKLEYLCENCAKKLKDSLAKELSGSSVKNESSDMNSVVQKILEGADLKVVLEDINAKIKSERAEFEKEFQNFLHSWNKLISAYEYLESDAPMLTDLFAEKYPFDKSFDDLIHDAIDWYWHVKEGLDEVVKHPTPPVDIKKLEQELTKELIAYMKSEGFDAREAKEYSRVTIDDSKDDYYDIEIGAELSYDGLVQLADKLDKVVEKYDKDAYFEPVTSGILGATVRK